MPNDVIEIITSDEDDPILLIKSPAGSNRPKLPLPTVSPPMASAGPSKSYPDESDILGLHLSPEPPPASRCSTPPPSPPRIDIEMSNLSRSPSPQIPIEAAGSGLQSLTSPRVDSPIRGPSSSASPEPLIPAPVQSSDDSMRSSAAVESPVVDDYAMFGPPWGLDSAAPGAVEPPAPAPQILANISQMGSQVRASASGESSIPNKLATSRSSSPALHSSIRTPPPRESTTQTPEPSPVIYQTLTTPASPATASPPIRPSFLFQMRTEPSVPPRPAANAIDRGMRIHSPGSLFGPILAKPSLSKVRSLVKSASSSNTLAKGVEGSQSTTLTTAHPIIVNEAQTSAPTGTRMQAEVFTVAAAAAANVRRSAEKGAADDVRKKEGPSLVIPVPYRSPEGQSLLDVINQAYNPAFKRPPIHIDLTLDDSVEEPSVPERVRRNAKLLEQFMASADEGENTEDVVPRECL
jgi:hypothetical protein